MQFLQRTRTRSKFMFKEEGREDLMESARDDFRTNLDHVNKYHMLSQKWLVFQLLKFSSRLLLIAGTNEMLHLYTSVKDVDDGC